MFGFAMLHSLSIVACCSFLFFMFVGKWLSEVVSLLFATYHEATIATKKEWIIRVNSTLHAVLASILCLVALYSDPEAFVNPIWNDSWSSSAVISMSFAYLISDAVNILFFLDYYDGIRAELTHHLVTAFIFFMCIFNGAYVHILVVRNLAEVSTPFVNFRWMMAVARMKKTRLYVINGMMLAVSFFIVRILLMPYAYVQLYLHLDTYRRMGRLIFLPIGAVIVDALNIMWFSKIVKGMLKYLKVGDEDGKRS